MEKIKNLEYVVSGALVHNCRFLTLLSFLALLSFYRRNQLIFCKLKVNYLFFNQLQGRFHKGTHHLC